MTERMMMGTDVTRTVASNRTQIAITTTAPLACRKVCVAMLSCHSMFQYSSSISTLYSMHVFVYTPCCCACLWLRSCGREWLHTLMHHPLLCFLSTDLWMRYSCGAMISDEKRSNSSLVIYQLSVFYSPQSKPISAESECTRRFCG